MARSSVGVPPLLARRQQRVFRPRDLTGIYAHPRAEVARLARAGAVRKLATGYYALVPQHRLGDQTWVPDPHAAALGVGQADYGTDAVALMGVSAARIHGAIPRELGVAVVAVPKQRPTLRLDVTRVVFVERRVQQFDIERASTELGPGWVTTIEQTILDLASRPALGGVEAADVRDALRGLSGRADWTIVEELAADQHRPAALRWARTFVEGGHDA